MHRVTANGSVSGGGTHHYAFVRQMTAAGVVGGSNVSVGVDGGLTAANTEGNVNISAILV